MLYTWIFNKSFSISVIQSQTVERRKFAMCTIVLLNFLTNLSFKMSLQFAVIIMQRIQPVHLDVAMTLDCKVTLPALSMVRPLSFQGGWAELK